MVAIGKLLGAAGATLGFLIASACNAPTSGPRGCAPDGGAGEVDNGTRFEAVDLGGVLTDDPGTSRTLKWIPRSTTREDWFKVAVADTGFGGDPIVRVRTTAGSATTWYVCDDGVIESLRCVRGEAGQPIPFGGSVGDVDGCAAVREPSGTEGAVESTTDCSGTSADDGVLWIRVTGTSCEPYTLTIDVR